MRTRHLTSVLALVAGGVALNPQPIAAQSWRSVSVARQIQGEEHFRVDVEFTAGIFELEPNAGSALYRAELVYDEEHFSPRTRYRPSSNTLRIGVTADDLRGRIKYDDNTRQRLHLAITPAVPTSLDLQFGAAKAEIELGGLSLLESSIKTGAADSHIAFSSPNRVPCRRLELAAGAAELRADHLGNARCERIDVAGGAGSLVLDFTGNWDTSRATRVAVKFGLGSLTLRLPEDLGVELDIEKLLVSFEKTDFTKRGSRYFSTNYDTAPTKLYIEINAALGDIQVEWVEQ